MEKSTAPNTTSFATTGQAKLDEALEMLQSGHRLKDIREKTGVDTSKLALVARRIGVRRGVFLENRVAIRLVTERGFSVQESSRVTGVPKHKIYYAIRSTVADKPMRLPSTEELARWDEMAAKRDSGASLAKIGKEYGVTRQRVHQLLIKRESYAQWRK